MPEVAFDYGVLRLHSDVAHAVDPNGSDEVIDGDTIKIGGERWRLFGWDAPPVSGNCCPTEQQRGADAKAYLAQLMEWGAAQGTLAIQVRGSTEKFKRRLVTITVGGRDVGEIMQEHGLADRYDGRGPKPVFCACDDKLAIREAEAKFKEARKAHAFARTKLRRNQ